MNIDIAQKIATTQPTTQPGAGADGAAGADKSTGAADFKDRLNNSQDPSLQQQQQPQGVQNTTDVQSAQQVNTQNQIPDKQDLFGRFEKVRKDFDGFVQRSSEMDKMVAEGKLRPDDPKVVQARQSEMREMLHFQSEMQSASVQVEIASKVVEHATSGLKTVLQTQA